MYVKNIVYLQNDYLNPQKNFRFLSKVLVKITHFEGMDNLMYMLIPLVPMCTGARKIIIHDYDDTVEKCLLCSKKIWTEK